MNVNMNMGEMSLTELQEIAMRQQQQIEINQQLLVAKEKRLKMLKLEEQKNQQLSQLSQQQMGSNEANTGNNQKLENLKQSVLSQELKIFKLKQLRNQILEYKLSNSNMYSELDLIKSLFADKERELFKAVNKVTELNKQIEQLKKMKSASKSTSGANGQAGSGSNMNELEKLKQELVIRNKLNEQQAKKIIQQHEVFNKKQIEVLALDKRIDELKVRIAAKRSQQLKTNSIIGNVLIAEQENALFSRVNHFIDEQQQQQQQQMLSEQNQAQSSMGSSRVAAQVLTANNANNINNSPSKQSAKFATKQEIANTYMNHQTKYHQQLSNRLQQHQQQQQQPLAPTPTPVQQQQQQQIPFIQLNSTHTKQTSHDENESTTSSSHSSSNLPSSSSSSLSPNNQLNNQQSPHKPVSLPVGLSMQSQQHAIAQSINQQANANEADGSTLPSHLKLEFDKIKFLPDVVKTIKKRHSISEMEGSVNTLPPQIIQKLLEKHQQQHQLSKINECNENVAKASNETHLQQQQQQVQVQSKPSTNEMTIKSTTVELVKSNQQQSQQPQQSQNTVFLSTFMSSQSNELKQRQQQQQQQSQPLPVQSSAQPVQQQVVTKSIIKQTNIDMQNQQAETTTTTNTIVSRRVNFDPHALLLDAAVEGELDLVMLCAQKVNDISEPNDEGITALHNSVCAGHFDIVKFLVDYCCDINYADNDGWTPLHCAASCNNIQMIKFLIENGASIFATTVSDNETAINKCEEDEDGYQMCFDYLLNAQNMMGDEKFNNGIVFALYSYDAENEDELSFKCNDKLKVVDKHEQEDDMNDGWWTCRLVDEQAEKGNMKEGLVPKNYLGLYPRVASRRINLAKLDNQDQVDHRRGIQQEESSTVC